jgi:hypothetical protein
MTDDHESRHAKVAADHYLHWFLTFAAAFWAGSQFGWLWSIAVFIGLIAVISISNTILLGATGSLRLLRANRWFWLILTLGLIAWQSSSIVTVTA